MKRAITILLFAVGLTPSGCGGGVGDPAPQATQSPLASTSPDTRPTAAAEPTAPADGTETPAPLAPLDPVASADGPDLESYRRRCKRLNFRGARARVLYEERKEMTRGDPDTVTAVVTLDRSSPPAKILRRPRAAEETGVIVSCQIQARLSASEYEFEVNKTGWVERSLLATETARWSWYVTPKVGGMQTLVLTLRPILKVSRTGSTKVSLSAEESNVQEYETSVHVNVPWTERPQETMSRLAATFKVAEGLVQALTLLVTGLISLGAVLGVRRRKRKRGSSGEDAPQPNA